MDDVTWYDLGSSVSVPVLSVRRSSIANQRMQPQPTNSTKPTKERNQPTQPETNMRYVGNDIYPAPQQGWLFPEGPSRTFKANKHLQFQYPIVHLRAKKSFHAAQRSSLVFLGGGQPIFFFIPLSTKPPSVRPLEKSDLGDQSAQKWNMQ